MIWWICFSYFSLETNLDPSGMLGPWRLAVHGESRQYKQNLRRNPWLVHIGTLLIDISYIYIYLYYTRHLYNTIYICIYMLNIYILKYLSYLYIHVCVCVFDHHFITCFSLKLLSCLFSFEGGRRWQFRERVERPWPHVSGWNMCSDWWGPKPESKNGGLLIKKWRYNGISWDFSWGLVVEQQPLVI